MKSWAVAIISVFSCVFALGVSGQQIMVGPNILVSKGQEKHKLGETLVAADPNNPNQLVGCTMIWLDGARRRGTIVYASFDGGKSWESTLNTNGFFDSADPAIAFGPDHTVIYSVIAKTTPDSSSRFPLVTYRSANGGSTWLPPVTILPFHPLDREFIVVDNTRGKYQDRKSVV